MRGVSLYSVLANETGAFQTDGFTTERAVASSGTIQDLEIVVSRLTLSQRNQNTVAP